VVGIRFCLSIFSDPSTFGDVVDDDLVHRGLHSIHTEESEFYREFQRNQRFVLHLHRNALHDVN